MVRPAKELEVLRASRLALRPAAAAAIAPKPAAFPHARLPVPAPDGAEDADEVLARTVTPEAHLYFRRILQVTQSELEKLLVFKVQQLFDPVRPMSAAEMAAEDSDPRLGGFGGDARSAGVQLAESLAAFERSSLDPKLGMSRGLGQPRSAQEKSVEEGRRLTKYVVGVLGRILVDFSRFAETVLRWRRSSVDESALLGCPAGDDGSSCDADSNALLEDLVERLERQNKHNTEVECRYNAVAEELRTSRRAFLRERSVWRERLRRVEATLRQYVGDRRVKELMASDHDVQFYTGDADEVEDVSAVREEYESRIAQLMDDHAERTRNFMEDSGVLEDQLKAVTEERDRIMLKNSQLARKGARSFDAASDVTDDGGAQLRDALQAERGKCSKLEETCEQRVAEIKRLQAAEQAARAEVTEASDEAARLRRQLDVALADASAARAAAASAASSAAPPAAPPPAASAPSAAEAKLREELRDVSARLAAAEARAEAAEAAAATAAAEAAASPAASASQPPLEAARSRTSSAADADADAGNAIAAEPIEHMDPVCEAKYVEEIAALQARLAAAEAEAADARAVSQRQLPPQEEPSAPVPAPAPLAASDLESSERQPSAKEDVHPKAPLGQGSAEREELLKLRHEVAVLRSRLADANEALRRALLQRPERAVAAKAPTFSGASSIDIVFEEENEEARREREAKPRVAKRSTTLLLSEHRRSTSGLGLPHNASAGAAAPRETTEASRLSLSATSAALGASPTDLGTSLSNISAVLDVTENEAEAILPSRQRCQGEVIRQAARRGGGGHVVGAGLLSHAGHPLDFGRGDADGIVAEGSAACAPSATDGENASASRAAATADEAAEAEAGVEWKALEPRLLAATTTPGPPALAVGPGPPVTAASLGGGWRPAGPVSATIAGVEPSLSAAALDTPSLPKASSSAIMAPSEPRHTQRPASAPSLTRAANAAGSSPSEAPRPGAVASGPEIRPFGSADSAGRAAVGATSRLASKRSTGSRSGGLSASLPQLPLAPAAPAAASRPSTAGSGGARRSTSAPRPPSPPPSALARALCERLRQVSKARN